MQQCVNLQLETGNHHEVGPRSCLSHRNGEVGDTDAYTEVIAASGTAVSDHLDFKLYLFLAVHSHIL